MGSPVSAVIANLVMEDVVERALASVPVSLSFWKRFVDDVISAVSRNEIDILLQHLNNSDGDTSVKSYAIVPYIQDVTEPIKRILSNCSIKVALKPYLTLGNIFAKPKDPVKTNQKTHAVYSIPCGDC
jgi:hypothetical protein